jgi:hypothetical protein
MKKQDTRNAYKSSRYFLDKTYITNGEIEYNNE